MTAYFLTMFPLYILHPHTHFKYHICIISSNFVKVTIHLAVFNTIYDMGQRDWRFTFQDGSSFARAWAEKGWHFEIRDQTYGQRSPI
jgi:hypothetical protein